MKILSIISVISFLSMMNPLEAGINSASFVLSDESYVNDIPFNTAVIARSAYSISALSNRKLTDESFVNDIPFNTGEIAQSAISYAANNSTNLTEESYVDDIPFNTNAIALAYQAEQSSIAANTLTDTEEYIDDIPFNTALIANDQLALMNEEGYIDDIPFSTGLLASQYKVTNETEKYVDDIPFSTGVVTSDQFMASSGLSTDLQSLEVDASLEIAKLEASMHSIIDSLIRTLFVDKQQEGGLVSMTLRKGNSGEKISVDKANVLKVRLAKSSNLEGAYTLELTASPEQGGGPASERPSGPVVRLIFAE